VEGLATSEEEEEFAYEAGAGNVEVPASTALERETERARKDKKTYG
jgi:hypothetical protein